MDELLFARLQMGLSLAFHIVFSVLGMALPVLIVLVEGLHLRTGTPSGSNSPAPGPRRSRSFS